MIFFVLIIYSTIFTKIKMRLYSLVVFEQSLYFRTNHTLVNFMRNYLAASRTNTTFSHLRIFFPNPKSLWLLEVTGVTETGQKLTGSRLQSSPQGQNARARLVLDGLLKHHTANTPSILSEIKSVWLWTRRMARMPASWVLWIRRDRLLAFVVVFGLLLTTEAQGPGQQVQQPPPQVPNFCS
jgi:hypothetical protein